MSDSLTATDGVFHSRILRQLEDAQLAVRVWTQYVSHSYTLGAKDSVDVDGTITRAPVD